MLSSPTLEALVQQGRRASCDSICAAAAREHPLDIGVVQEALVFRVPLLALRVLVAYSPEIQHWKAGRRVEAIQVGDVVELMNLTRRPARAQQRLVADFLDALVPYERLMCELSTIGPDRVEQLFLLMEEDLSFSLGDGDLQKMIRAGGSPALIERTLKHMIPAGMSVSMTTIGLAKRADLSTHLIEVMQLAHLCYGSPRNAAAVWRKRSLDDALFMAVQYGAFADAIQTLCEHGAVARAGLADFARERWGMDEGTIACLEPPAKRSRKQR